LNFNFSKKLKLVLNNPELINSVALDVIFNRSPEKSDFDVALTTVSSKGEEQKRLELTYRRK
jgi:hypothetical protein